jgi:hypothetical protein
MQQSLYRLWSAIVLSTVTIAYSHPASAKPQPKFIASQISSKLAISHDRSILTLVNNGIGTQAIKSSSPQLAKITGSHTSNINQTNRSIASGALQGLSNFINLDRHISGSTDQSAINQLIR